MATQAKYARPPERVLGEFGDRLRGWREKRGLTQIQIAGAVNVRQVTVSTWECGTKRPSVEHLLGLCRVLRVPIDRLLYEDAA